jgi:hypothetical protein
METAQFKVIEGKVPVLISAPHVYPCKRPNISGIYKPGEVYTRDIVEQVCADTGAFGIYLNDECNYDPNYHKERKNEYKQTVRDLIKKYKIERFIDIHGLKECSYDIGLYYTTRFSKSLNFAYEIEKRLNHGKLSGINIEIFRFLDNGQETLGEFVASKMRVPSVQIEIARYIRNEEELRESFIKNLSEIVKNYI